VDTLARALDLVPLLHLHEVSVEFPSEQFQVSFETLTQSNSHVEYDVEHYQGQKHPSDPVLELSVAFES